MSLKLSTAQLWDPGSVDPLPSVPLLINRARSQTFYTDALVGQLSAAPVTKAWASFLRIVCSAAG